MLATAIRIGNSVTLAGKFINSSGIASNTKFGNIPKLCRPTSNITRTAYADSTSNVTFHVYSDGAFDYVSGAVRSTLEFAISYKV